MTYPDDTTMLMLLAHAAGDRFEVVDGALVVTVGSEGRCVPAPEGALDELESRGWLVVDGATRITERGRYWLCRWLTARKGKGVLKGARL